MVGLNGEDAGGGCQVTCSDACGADETGGSVVRGDPDIFEDKGADQEAVEISKGIEGDTSDTGRGGEAGKGGCEVNGGAGYGGLSESLAQELHMRLLVVGDLIEDLLLRIGKIRDLGAAGDISGISADICRGEAAAGGCTEVELSLEVLQIKGEVEDVGVGEGRHGWHDGDGTAIVAARNQSGCAEGAGPR